MKTLLLLLSLAGILSANADVKWVDEKVAAIKPPRQGISDAAIDNVRDPFKLTKDESKKSTSASSAPKPTAKKAAAPTKKDARKSGPLKLYAIMNGSALINGTWYKVNEKVLGYKVAKIEHVSVLLTRGKESRKLFITTENKNIKIQTK